MCLPPKTMNNANETNSSILGAKPAEDLYVFVSEICDIKGREQCIFLQYAFDLNVTFCEYECTLWNSCVL